MEHPKVFISHASEDKERFVLDFATKLRTEQGIDAFVDAWEIAPGDSLVKRIFDEGIGRAQAVIVILSVYSINKPWVREELDVSTVRKIEDGIKLIPVLIGDIEKHQIPMSLRATVWERITNLNEYDAEIARIVQAIYGNVQKPPLSDPPSYTEPSLATIPGFSSVDSVVLQACCEKEIQAGARFDVVDTEGVVQEAADAGLHREQVGESIKILDEEGLVKAIYTNDVLPLYLTLTDIGFDEYGRIYIPEYESLVRSVGFEIVNGEERQSNAMAENLGISSVILEHILGLLESWGYIELFVETGPLSVSDVSPKLRRWLEET